MDNFQVDVTSLGKEKLVTVFSLFNHSAIGYRVDNDKGLILYCYESKKMIPLPFKMNMCQAAGFAFGWLEGAAVYGQEPDHDGDNKHGWRVYCEDWGHVGHEHEAFVAIQPVWAMYGK